MNNKLLHQTTAEHRRLCTVLNKCYFLQASLWQIAAENLNPCCGLRARQCPLVVLTGYTFLKKTLGLKQSCEVEIQSKLCRPRSCTTRRAEIGPYLKTLLYIIAFLENCKPFGYYCYTFFF